MAYSDKQKTDIINTICKRIEKGEALRTILKEKGMPSSSTFFIWIDADEDKSKQYARALELRAEQIFEDILLIADDQENDVYYDANGNEIINHNVINRCRLRVDARKWMLGKMQPKKYGDKLDVTSDGESIAPKKDLSELSDEELIQYKALQSKLK